MVWLGGFNSDMGGTKAVALGDWAAATGRAYVRFDYFGHGASSGDVTRGTISRWREDALAIVDELTSGPLLLVGSSMGGWLATLVALARPACVTGLVLIAPAADMTDKLIEPGLNADARAALASTGLWLRPSPYGPGDPITRELLEDGARWSVLPGPVACRLPLRVLQGGADADVPWAPAMALAPAWEGQDGVFTLVGGRAPRLESTPAPVRLSCGKAHPRRAGSPALRKGVGFSRRPLAQTS